MLGRPRTSAAVGCAVAAPRADGAGRGSRCPWWCRSGCAAPSSPAASRTSGRSASAPPADHARAALGRRSGRSTAVSTISGTHNRELVTQNQDLDLLRAVRPGPEHQPPQEFGERLVDQLQRHRGIMPRFRRRGSIRSAGVSQVSGTHTGRPASATTSRSRPCRSTGATDLPSGESSEPDAEQEPEGPTSAPQPASRLTGSCFHGRLVHRGVREAACPGS